MTAEEKENHIRWRMSQWKRTTRLHREKVRLSLFAAAGPIRSEAQAARDRGLDVLAEDLMCEAEAFESVAHLLGSIA